MKILYVTTIGITMGFFNSFIRGLLNDGHVVDIATNESDNNSIPPCYREWGCKVYQIDTSRSPFSKGNINAVKQLKILVEKEKYDIVHCHTPVASFLTRIASRRARKNGTKVIYTAHGFHFYKGAPLINWLIYFPIEWISSFFTDTLITINKEDYEFAKKHMHAKEIKYIPGIGIDTKKYFECAVDVAKKREEINIPKNSIVLFSIGELNENKNHKLVIEAISKLKKYDIQYCIAGNGNMKEKLKKIAGDNGVLEKVHFLGYRSDIKELLSISDLFCFPSFREGLPVSVMEAMACGLPCIVTKIRGNTDLIQHERNGLLISAKDSLGLANAIERLILDDNLREKMSKHNIKDIEKFDVQNVKSIMSEIYLAHLG